MKRALLLILSLAVVSPAWADKRVDDALAKAQDAIRKGKPDDAIKNMTKMAGQVNTAEAWIALARVQRQTGARDEAAATIRKAADTAATPADKATALAALTELLLREGSGKDALLQAQASVAAQETPASLGALARAQARAEDIPAALATIEKAMKAGAPTAYVHESNGDVLLAGGKPVEAAAAYRAAMAADANLVSARAGLAAALSAQGKHAEAVTEAKAAVEADANSAEAQYVLGTALLAQDPKAMWGEAIAAAQQAVFISPKNVAAQVAVARIFEAGGNLQQATAAYGAALAIDPEYVPAMVGRIQGLARQQKYDEALNAAKQLVAARPKSGNAQLLYGTMLARRGQWAEAATALQVAVDGGMRTGEAYAMLGTSLLNAGKRPEALTAYKGAVDLDPRNVGYKTTYGLLLGLAGREPEGIKILNEVVSDPAYKDADAWINLGWLYRSMEPINAAESVKAYTKGLQIEPDNIQAQLGLAWAQYYNKAYADAIASFTKVAAADETLRPAAYSGAGWSHLFNKNLAEAKAFAAKAASAGRADKSLEDQIKAVEAGQEARQRAIERAADEAVRPAAVASGPDGAIQVLFQRTDAGSLSKAANECRKYGTACLDGLVHVVTKASAAQGGRQAACNAIAAMGTAGKKADPYLRQVIPALKCDEVIPSPACLAEAAKKEPLLKACEAALRAVNGR